MNRLSRTLATIAVAGILPASAIVAAQQQPAAKVEDPPKAVETAKQAAPAPPPAQAEAVGVTTKTTVQVIKVRPVAKEAGNADAPKNLAKPEVKKEAAKVEVKVIRRAPAVPAQNLEPQIQRFVVQLRPLVRSEIHLVLTVCSPNAEQKAAIRGEEDRVTKDVAREIAQFQMGLRHNNNVAPDPRKLIPDAMAKVVKERLSPEQADRYKAESEAKFEFSRKVALASLASSLDDELMLSADQRARLVQALDSHWRPGWHGSLQAQLNNNQIMPDVPNDVMEPILDPVQKRVWDKLRKSGGNFYYGNYLMMGNFAIEEPAETPPPPVAKPADAPANK